MMSIHLITKLKDISLSFFYTPSGERLDQFDTYKKGIGANAHNLKVDQLYELTYWIFRDVHPESINKLKEYLKELPQNYTHTPITLNKDWFEQYRSLDKRLEHTAPGILQVPSGLVITCGINIAKIQYEYQKEFNELPTRSQVLKELKSFSNDTDKYSRVINSKLDTRVNMFKSNFQYILKN